MTYHHNIYKPGDRKVQCAICGFVYRLSEMKTGVSTRQKGYAVCPDCFDPVHPLENKPSLRSAPAMKTIGVEGRDDTS